MSIALCLPPVGLSLAAGSLTPYVALRFPVAAAGAGPGTDHVVASEGGVARGGIVLGAFGVGAATPLVAVGCASRSGFSRVRYWVLSRIERVRHGDALLLGAIAVAILTGGDKWLEARVRQWLPEAWVNLTVGIC